MQTIMINGEPVSFPDSMSDAEIVAAIKAQNQEPEPQENFSDTVGSVKDWLVDGAMQARPVVEDAADDMLGQLPRAAGLVTRDVATGLATLPLAALDLAAYPINAVSRAVTGDDVIANYQQTFSNGLSELGMPVPANDTERLLSAVTRGSSAALSGVGIGKLLAGSANMVTRGVGNLLASTPAIQVTAGAGSGYGGEKARQEGFGPTGQMLSSIAGGIVGGFGAGRIDARPRTTALPRGAVTTAKEAAALRVPDKGVLDLARTGSQRIGLDFDTLDDSVTSLMKTNARQSIARKSNSTPEEIARKSVYESVGIKPTKAMVTRKFADALDEQNLLKEKEGGALRNIYAENNRAIKTQIQQLAPDDTRATDLPTFGEKIRRPLEVGQRRSQKMANNIYKKAELSEGDMQSNIQPVVNFLQDNGPLMGSMEKTKPVVAYMKQIGAIADDNMVPTANGTGYKALPISLKELSKLRETVNRSWKSAVKSGDDSAAHPLNELRTLINEAEKKAGGELYKAYRQFRVKKGARYENNPLIDSLTKDKTGYHGTDFIEDSMVFDKAVIKSTSEQFKTMWPRLTPKAQNLTRAQVGDYIENKVFGNMAMNEQGDVVASAAKLTQVLSKISPEKLRTIYGQQKFDNIQRLNVAVRELSNPPSGTIPMGSAPALTWRMDLLIKALGLTKKVPALGAVSQGGINAIESGTKSAANRSLSKSALGLIEGAPSRSVQSKAGIIPALSVAAGDRK